MRWSTDMASLRHLSPRTLTIVDLTAPDDTPVVFTLGFDSAGLARYIDISISQWRSVPPDIRFNIVRIGRLCQHHQSPVR